MHRAKPVPCNPNINVRSCVRVGEPSRLHVHSGVLAGVEAANQCYSGTSAEAVRMPANVLVWVAGALLAASGAAFQVLHQPVMFHKRVRCIVHGPQSCISWRISVEIAVPGEHQLNGRPLISRVLQSRWEIVLCQTDVLPVLPTGHAAAGGDAGAVLLAAGAIGEAAAAHGHARPADAQGVSKPVPC